MNAVSVPLFGSLLSSVSTLLQPEGWVQNVKHAPRITSVGLVVIAFSMACGFAVADSTQIDSGNLTKGLSDWHYAAGAGAGGTLVGVWSQSDSVGKASCHPHCQPDPSQGGYGDLHHFNYTPHEQAPAGFHFEYTNPRMIGQMVGACVFDPFTFVNNAPNGADLYMWSRSDTCSFVVGLDKYQVPGPPH